MTLADVTALMSKVGRKHPELVQSREVALFIEAVIEEAQMAGVHDYTGAFTLDESVELARAEREGYARPMHVGQEVIRAWLVEQRLRWAKEGHPDYQGLLDQ